VSLIFPGNSWPDLDLWVLNPSAWASSGLKFKWFSHQKLGHIPLRQRTTFWSPKNGTKLYVTRKHLLLTMSSVSSHWHVQHQQQTHGDRKWVNRGTRTVDAFSTWNYATGHCVIFSATVRCNFGHSVLDTWCISGWHTDQRTCTTLRWHETIWTNHVTGHCGKKTCGSISYRMATMWSYTSCTRYILMSSLNCENNNIYSL